MTTSSFFRHILTFLAGLGGLLVSWNLIAPAEVEAVNQAGAELIAPLTVILGALAACVARLVIAMAGKIFRNGSGENNGGPGGLPLWVVGCMVAVLMGLPSCTPLAGFPIKATFLMQDGSISYSSKGGIEAAVYGPAGRMPAIYQEK